MRRLSRSVPLVCVLLAACHAGSCDVSGTLVITVKDLDPHLSPSASIDDGNGKDVVLKTRAAFKPSKGGSAQLSKRLRIRSKTDGGGGGLASEVELTGDISSQVRVAVDSVAGLVDGASLGFLERQPAVDAPVTRVEAVWNAGQDGFTARALVDGAPVGTTLDLPGAHEVFLWIEDTGTDLLLRAGEATGETLADVGTSATLHTQSQDPGDTTASYRLGAAGLGQKATLWLAQFTLRVGDDGETGPVELAASVQLATSWYWLGVSLDTIETTPNNVISLLSTVGSAFTPLFEEESALADGLAADTLLPTTNAQAALDGSLDARIQLTAAIAKLDALALVGATDGSMIKSRLQKARDAVEIALACVHGFKKSGHAKLANTVDVSVE